MKHSINELNKHLWFLILLLITGIVSPNAFAQKKKKKVKKNKGEVVDTINMQSNYGKLDLQLTFLKGESYNHPTFAIWLEDMEGNLIETLFVTQYYATGIFGNADAGDGTWKPTAGESIRPAALPYWSHKNNVISRDSIYAPTPENPVPDAISGATPAGSFVLYTSASAKLPETFRILLEINQTWDWNDYWTNNKYPNDKNYKSSAQPSLVYETKITADSPDQVFQMKAIGHGHYAGDNGQLFNDLSTLSTALNIAKEIQVSLMTQN